MPRPRRAATTKQVKVNKIRSPRTAALRDSLGAGKKRMTSKQNVADSRFRKRYRELTPAELKWNDEIKDYAAKLEVLTEALNPSRYAALALTHLETAVMFAVKQLTGAPPINPKTSAPFTATEVGKLLRGAKRAKAD
jgi:hypothetical protein